MSFDYEYLDHWECEYGVPSKHTPDQFANCGDRAVATCWWRKDKSDRMFLCEKHLMELIDDAETGKEKV